VKRDEASGGAQASAGGREGSDMDGGGPVLEVVGVGKRFGDSQVLSDVSFSLHAGETIALVGENGAGKSTLIRMLSGALEPDYGEILIDGQPAALHQPAAAQQAGIATVFQEFNLFDELSVAENLFLGGYPYRSGVISWASMRREAEDFLSSFGLSLDVRQKVGTLSVASKQLLEIAKAIRSQARVVILDEPTAVLGDADVERLFGVMREMHARGVAMIFVSHRLNEVLEICDHYVVLRDGVLVDRGRTADTSHDDLVTKMVGRALSIERDRGGRPGAPAAEVLRVEDLDRAGVLRDISLSVRAGEIVGVAGLRGAGRTELARAIFGADPISSGQIFVHGRPVRVSSPRAAVRLGLGLVPEERGSQGLFKQMSTIDNIPIARQAASGSRLVRPRSERKKAREYVGRLAMRVPNLGGPVGRLSGGNQQKVVLAKWLEADVGLLILDEPTRGVDIGAKEEIYGVIRRLSAQGVGVLLISSELPEILALSDRILVMHEGAITAELNGPSATEEQIMTAAVGRVAA
jgi:ABC-type sugar transport system ATPase subunit